MRIYTDGSCRVSGVGGWAWVMEGSPGVSGSGGVDVGTSQRMEMQAVLEALSAFPKDDVTIISDSKYVVNCFNQGWWRRWIENGWKTTVEKDVANRDLWELLLSSIKDRDVIFEWVKGHSGDLMNELADSMATGARLNHLSNRGL